jgi:hypothetical protein
MYCIHIHVLQLRDFHVLLADFRNACWFQYTSYMTIAYISYSRRNYILRKRAVHNIYIYIYIYIHTYIHTYIYIYISIYFYAIYDRQYNAYAYMLRTRVSHLLEHVRNGFERLSDKTFVWVLEKLQKNGDAALSPSKSKWSNMHGFEDW